ncbi:hypothetical protein LCGC14_1130590 [marine sediment metagenome]|uniref:Uncharacterized protein n=1 Tax=marine sediment metagenome TaxID=412755 RepID=A0A0F9PJF3_9ZZZZ
MNEENKQEVEEVGKEDSIGAKENGDKYETTPIIERAREEREKMEAANTKREELLDREEAIMAKRELGGRAEAGGQKDTSKEENPKEYRARINKEMSEGKTEFGN